MSNKDGSSIAPKERINIRYVPKTDGQVAEVELPLNLLIVGDLKGASDTSSLDERQPIAIDRNNFNAVIAEAGIKTEFSVPATLSGKPDDRMHISLDVKSLSDLTPDGISKQVTEMKKLLELREALVALKGPMGNLPAFRAQLRALLENEETRDQLIKELGIVSKK